MTDTSASGSPRRDRGFRAAPQPVQDEKGDVHAEVPARDRDGLGGK